MSTPAATLLESVAPPGNLLARSDSARSESFAAVAQPGAATTFGVSYTPTRTPVRSTKDTESLASASSQSTLSLSSPGSPTFISSSQTPIETPLVALQSVGSSTESSAESTSTVSQQFITSSSTPASESTSVPSTPSSVVSGTFTSSPSSQTDPASTAAAQDANSSSSLPIFTASTASDISGTQLATISSSADIITSTSQAASSSPSPTQTATLSSVANSQSVDLTISTLPSSQSASLSTGASQVLGTSRDTRPPMGTSALIFISSSSSTSSDSPTPVAAVAGPSETTTPFVQLTTIPVQTTLASNSGTATSGQVVAVTQIAGTMSTPAAPSATSERADAARGHGVNILVATLVPATLVVLALLVAGLLFVRRIRRNRRAWFMATYEDLTGGGDVEYAASSRRSSWYGSAGSIPSAASAHRDMVQRLPALVEDPFADPVDVHTPLVGHARAESATRALTPTSFVGARRGARSPALPDGRSSSPGAKAGRRLSAVSVIGRSPSPRAMSTKAGSRQSAVSVDWTNPREWADMDDPFADPNKRTTG